MRRSNQFLMILVAILAVALAVVARTESSVVHGTWSTNLDSRYNVASGGAYPADQQMSALASPLPPPPPAPRELTQIALEHVADREGARLTDLVAVNEHSRSYALTGQDLWAVTVLDRQTAHFHHVLINPANRSVADPEAVSRSEREAHLARYGKLEPALRMLLQSKDRDDEVKVMIWATPIDLESVLDQLGAMHPEMRHDSARPMDVSDPSLSEAIAADYRELLAAAHLAKVQEVTRSLESQGYEVTRYRFIPAVVAELPKSTIHQLAQREDVSSIYITGRAIQPALDSAVPTVRAPEVWARGIDGSGVRIAVVEDGKVENHQGLNVVATRTITLGVTNHATYVAGVAALDHPSWPAYRGVAPDAGIVSAATYGSSDDVVEAIEFALIEGVGVINSSFSVSSEDDDMHELDRVYDYFARYVWLSMPTGAGNMEAGNHTGTPGKAYNVITVGAFDDHNDPSWAHDSMRTSSAYRNPKTDDGTYGDREKPEVVAVGADVVVLGTNGDWVSVAGTSIATPQVSGMVALLMQRDSMLRFWPEAVRAIIMASAMHNIEGPSIMRVDGLDDRDGAGGIVADRGDVIALTRGDYGSTCLLPCWWGDTIGSQSFPVGTYRYYTFTASADALVPVVIAWDSAPADDYSTDPLKTNLDLLLLDPDGQPLDGVGGYSASWDNSYEIAEFMSRRAGNYRIGVYKHSAEEDSNSLGVAWTQRLMPYKVNLPLCLKEA